MMNKNKNIEKPNIMAIDPSYVRGDVIITDDIEQDLVSIEGDVGIIRVDKELSYTEAFFFTVSYKDIEDAIDYLEGNDAVKSILFFYNSPGGVVSGITECMDRITAIKKPTYSYAGGLCTSGAFMLAYQSDYFYASPTATLGSFGVITSLYDQKKHLQSMGYPYDEITNDGSEAKRPRFGNAQDKNYITKLMNDIITQILVRMNSPVQTIDFFGNGRVFSGKEALNKKWLNGVISMRQLKNQINGVGDKSLEGQSANQQELTDAKKEIKIESVDMSAYTDQSLLRKEEAGQPNSMVPQNQVTDINKNTQVQNTPDNSEGAISIDEKIDAKVQPLISIIDEQKQVIAQLQAHNSELEKKTNTAAVISAGINHVAAPQNVVNDPKIEEKNQANLIADSLLELSVKRSGYPV